MEGRELSDEPVEGGPAPDADAAAAAPGPSTSLEAATDPVPDPPPDVPAGGQDDAPGAAAPAPATQAAALLSDPLHVGEDIPPVATRPMLPHDPARSPDPWVCPFLRRDVNGTLLAPASVPGAQQVCVAVGSPRPQSLRQQELVCLREAHTDCPRYQRGMEALDKRGRRALGIPTATLVALLILVASAALSFGFVLQRGGIAMPAVVESPSAVAEIVTPSPAVTEAPAATVAPTPAPTPSPDPTPSPTAVTTPSPSPTPAPTPSPTVAPTPAPTATPKSARYALLTPCPNRKACYIYTVRGGDNLFSIARYFGHPLSTIYKWNPQYPGTRLRAGAQILMPPPTR